MAQNKKRHYGNNNSITAANGCKYSIGSIAVVEAAAHAAKQYNSTLAVFKLDEVLANAVRVVEDLPKAGNKNQRKLIRMILMSFKDPNLGTIKLSVGVRNRTLDKIQYGITALAENESIVTASEKNKKKAPHK